MALMFLTDLLYWFFLGTLFFITSLSLLESTGAVFNLRIPKLSFLNFAF